ncbi:trypsin-like peptidase domain-containing protein [Mucilaginibacter sp. OK098]|uniref:trypsin-like peptidase domain-containing protein n=1 Tax=Mucilaginibacter sp. OK098 TaxID=1855297 RepID=UPI0009230A81|nr:trypsin-like peptidase domain-containing protein [Mucilaginibacter sp. OK098]SHM54410.1 hypothetical protein SAMN05216524_102466 [Mucilaginibacter sp. OK098]
MKVAPKTLLIFIIVLLVKSSLAQITYQGPIADDTYLSTVKLTKSVTEKITMRIKKRTIAKDTTMSATGTGFFVYRTVPNLGYKVFLVTNKHMIGDWSLGDSLIVNKNLSVSFYTKSNLFRVIDIPLKDVRGKIMDNVHPYPNQSVDVVVIDVTGFIMTNSSNDLAIYAIDINNLISINNLFSYQIFTGNQVLATGYPSGVQIVSQSKPMVKSAIISSPLTSPIDVNMIMENRNHKFVSYNISAKLILIDGYIVGGNSGGPVFTPRDKNISDPKTTQGQFNYVIGIVSAVYNNTGLSLIYSSDYIKDLIYKYSNN